MTNEEREQRTEAGVAEHKAMLAKYHGTPVLCIGVGHAPGEMPGKFIVSLAGKLPLSEAYHIITAMQEELAAKLGVL